MTTQGMRPPVEELRVGKLSFNPDCGICRFAARYSKRLVPSIRLVPWVQDEPAPRFILDRLDFPEYQPYLLMPDGRLVWGEDAVIGVHVLRWPRAGLRIGRVVLRVLKVLQWLLRTKTKT